MTDDFQTIQHRLAEVKTEAAIGRSFCDTAMKLFMEGIWLRKSIIDMFIYISITCLMNRTF